MPIDTPETIAAIVAGYDSVDRARFDAALQNYATARNVPDEEEYQLTDEDKMVLSRAAADDAAGRVHNAEDVYASIRKEFGWTKK